MANIDLGTATGHIVLDASGVSSGVNVTNQALTSLNEVVRNNWWGLKNVGDQLLILAGIAAAALGGAAAAAVQWEDAMAKIETQSFDATKSAEQNAAALNQVSDGLKNLALNSPTPIAALAGIAQGAAALGVRSEDIVGFTKVVNNLANTTDASASTSTQALGRLTTGLGLSSEQVGRAGDVIFELSRKTPATATQIEQLSERLIGLQSSAGLTTPQILAISAAVSSVAPNARTGATAINAIFEQMANSVRDGGDQIQRFSVLTGQSAEAFAEQFRTNASGALVQFLQGLDQAQASGLNLSLVLEGLGIKNTQQQQVILALAQAQEGAGASTARLSSELAIANDAWVQNTALSAAAERQYSTVGAQLAEMRNAIVEAAQAFGQTFLPILKPIVIAITDVVVGIANLPGPIRVAISVLLALSAGVLAFGAAIFLLGPRILLAQDALGRLVDVWRQMQPEAIAAAEAIAAEEAATAAASAAAAAYSAELQAQRAELQLVALQEGQLAEARVATAEASAAASASAAAVSEARVNLSNAEYEALLLVNGATALSEEGMAVLVTAMEGVAAAEEQLIAAQTVGVETSSALAASELLLARAENAEAIAADNAARARLGANASQEASIALNGEAAASQAGLTAETAAASSAITGQSAATAESAAAGAAGVEAMASSTAGLTTAAGEAAAGTAELAGGLEAAGVAADATGVGLPIGAILAVAGVAVLGAGALGLFGSSHRKAAEDGKQNISVNQDLVRILQEQGGQLDADARKWTVQQLAMSGALAESEKLKISARDLFAVITGTADQSVAQGLVNAIKQAEDAGDPGAKALGDTVHKLFLEFQLSSEAAQEQSTANRDLGVSSNDAAGSVDGLGSALEQTKQKTESMAQASISYIDALLGLRSAQNGVRDAENQLRAAREQASQIGLAEEKNSIDLERAKLGEVKANNDLVKANDELATARQRQSDATAKAERSLRDVLERSMDTDDRVRDAQRALNEAMSPAPTLELEDATNKLADARLRLIDDNKSVADAEWQLQFLMQEGASGRDIQDAQDTLAKSKQKQVDDTTEVGKAQDELNKKQEGDPAKIESAQRQLRDALRAQRDAVEAVVDAQNKLLKAQEDQANDTIFKDALLQQEQAQLAVRDAAIQLEKANLAVRDSAEQRSKAADSVRKAEDSITDALFREAKAQTEVQKQAALARGEQFTASDEAIALAQNLIDLGNTVGGPVGAQMVELGTKLRNTLTPANYGFTNGNPVPVSPIDTTNAAVAGQTLNQLNEQTKTGNSNTWDTVKLVAENGIAFLAGLVGGPVAASIAGAIVRFFFDPVPRVEEAWNAMHGSTFRGLLAIGGTIFDLLFPIPGQIVRLLTGNDNIFTSIYNIGKNVIVGLFNGIGDALRDSWHVIEDLPGNIVHELYKGFHLGSPSKLTHQHGVWLVEGLMNGIEDQFPKLEQSLGALTTIVAKNPALMSDITLRGGGYVSPQAAQASVPWTSTSGDPGTSVTHEGDNFHFHEVVPSAKDIMSEVGWQKRIKTRN